MEATVKKTWMPTTAGILNIITGALSALMAIGIIIAIVAVDSISIMRYLPPADAPFIAPLVSTILIVVLVLAIIRAVLTTMGGVFALQRKKWGWALVGSILAMFGQTFPLGLVAIIFVAMAKDEFE